MRRFLFLCLLLLGLLSGGCSSHEYRWVTTPTGLPEHCTKNVQFKDVEIQYCIVPSSGGGEYFEGVMIPKKYARNAFIKEGLLHLHLMNNGEIVYRTTLSRSGFDLSKKILLHSNIRYAGPYDELVIWSDIKYSNDRM